jgi:endonuclease/exonuclease/phosphatase family metal-dependent hydrolase
MWPASASCLRSLAALLAVSASVASVTGTSSSGVAAEWKRLTDLSAPEAHQAAAADEQHVYAITNTRIARYDRETGQRISVSTGDAQHLNSGFLWNGRLYCAHSNYPRTPEHSQIKVLDPQSMQLSTFKDFGNFGGSLTWVVRHDGTWWCNFARYGDDNAGTFLVRFDDEWRETGRWTYPAEVTRQLGRYSLSGGLWHEGALLVTGHDDPVLFRLRLPEAGGVLQFVDTQAAPFTGQGIAHDPRTGGLVGINRARREVVLAVPGDGRPLRLRVLTYNIHHGEGVDGRLDLERIAGVINAVEPDVVALQEVDRNVRRTASIDQPAELARLTKLQVVFGANIDLEGGEYGNAVLSRCPIRSHTNHKLPRFDDGEQRGALEVEIELPGGRSPLLFLTTHLDHRRDARERLASAEAINKFVAAQPDRPALLAGDLNAVPDSRVLAACASEWIRGNREILPTVPVGQPSRQIDYVLFRPERRWSVIEARVLDEAIASDHRALLVVLELSGSR